MTALSMASVRTLRKDAIDELHRVRQVAPGRLEHEVIVIAHQADSEDEQVVQGGREVKDLDEATSIIIVMEIVDRRLPRAMT